MPHPDRLNRRSGVFMTAYELIEKLMQLPHDAEVRIAVTEPYDDEPEELEESASDIEYHEPSNRVIIH